MFYSAKQIGFKDILDVETRISARKNLTQSAIQDISNYNWQERYDYFLNSCVAHQEIWATWAPEGMFMFEWDGAREHKWYSTCTPIFPNKELAEEFFKNYKNMEFSPVPIDDFIDEVCPPLAKGKIRLCVFPTLHSDETIILDVGDMIIDLSGSWKHIMIQNSGLIR